MAVVALVAIVPSLAASHAPGLWTPIAPRSTGSALPSVATSDPHGPSELAAARASLAAGAAPASPSILYGANWSQVTYAPSVRYSSEMAYDAADKYVVLFGGWHTNFLGDTWIFNGHWTQLLPKTSPAPRSSAMMAYDYKDGYVLLFGGLGGAGTLSDTWKFVHGSWTKLTPAKSPVGVSQTTMVWDANDSYVLLFGGTPYNSAFTAVATTWTFVGGNWVNRSATPSPSARVATQMTYDPTDGWVLLFGGESPFGASLHDTWNYSHGLWTLRTPASSPPGVFGGVLTNDSVDKYLVLIGGTNSSTGKSQAATWTFAAGTWTRVTPAINPSARAYSAMVYDASLSKVVLVGGITRLGGTYLGDTWTYRSTSWLRLVFNTPPGRYYATMTYDESDGCVLLFGGADQYASGHALGDTWTFAKGHWTHLHLTNSPPARYAAAMTYDQADGYVLLFGGFVPGVGALGDTWSFVGGTWTNLSPTVSPAPRDLASMAYDAQDGYTVLFGGQAGYYAFNDTWTFLDGIWMPVDANACLYCGPMPPQNSGALMVYDAWDGYLVLFGGVNNSVGYYSDQTWTYSAGSWSNLTATAGTPTARWIPAGAYDATDGHVFMYGGTDSSQLGLSDSDSFVAGTWTQLFPSVNPGADQAATMAYDALDSEVVYMPGYIIGSPTWLY